MIEALLALIGMGQLQSHRSTDRYASASSHLSNVENICLETGIKLEYEIQRLTRLAEEKGVQPVQAVDPLVKMAAQNEQLNQLAAKNRDLLREKGANAHVVTELERWESTCKVMPTQIDLTVRQIEEALLSI